MLTIAELLQAVLLPAVVAMALALVARWRGWGWALPLAIGAGFVAGWMAFRGAPTLPPRDGTDWLFWLAAADAALAAVVVAVVDRLPPWGVVLCVVCLALATGLTFGVIA